MKNLLSPKPNRLLIQFKESRNLAERIESFRTTSVDKAQKIINKRNTSNILFASFCEDYSRLVRTDKNTNLNKVIII